MDLRKIATRLDNEEKMWLKYRAPIGSGGKNEIRKDRLLDVAEESDVLYVDRDGQPVWVRVDEVIEIITGDCAND
ncbi:MAG: hypothetical protein ABFD46_05820 [Armatimonadota bacterium]